MKNWSLIMFLTLALSIIKAKSVKNTRKNDEFIQLTAYKEKFSSIKNCTKACFPETGDLLIGRKNFLYASSTCGFSKPERYCVLGQLSNDRTTKCYVCDSRDPYSKDNRNSHGVENIVSDIPFSRDDNKWWQSENGISNVYIQFDLEAEFIFTHFIMTFRTFRPSAMVVERSSDYGYTWKPYVYFAWNCHEAFPYVSNRLPTKLGDVYCESRYSSPTPSKGGEVVFKAIPPDLLTKKNPYSHEIISLLKITNLRVNFTKLHTFGDTEIDSREELREKYYYALSGMIIRGSCLCYGHASNCIADSSIDYDVSIEQKNFMVHSKCACEHNTDGSNCEKCLPLYNDRPWSPASLTDSNACVKCECNDHADSCHFNSTKYIESGNLSGGICDNCQHNTRGDHCDECIENHWRDFEVDLSHHLACKPCNCDVRGSYKKTCNHEETPGQCSCKPNVDGRQCNKCKIGYFNLTAENEFGCQKCQCNTLGTKDNLGCNQINGNCICKKNVIGQQCNQCKKGFYGLDDSAEGCKACDCDQIGSVSTECDRNTGQCLCKKEMTGRRCDKLQDDHFCPAFDHIISEAEDAELSFNAVSHIKYAPFDIKDKKWTGSGYVSVTNQAELKFILSNIEVSEQYYFALRYDFQNNSSWNKVTLSIEEVADGIISVPDRECVDSYPNQVMLGQATLDSNKRYHAFKVRGEEVCLDKSINYEVTLKFELDEATKLLVDSLVIFPDFDAMSYYDEFFKHSGNLEKFNFCLEKSYEPRQIQNYLHECQSLICLLSGDFFEARKCKCDEIGSFNSSCENIGGQCFCHSNVNSLTCSACSYGSWGFSSSGCQLCNCDPQGSKDPNCDINNGQCQCYDNIKGKKCNECKLGFWDFPLCRPCECNGYAATCDSQTGQCFNCSGYTTGHSCEICIDGYFGSPASGIPCKKCSCPGGPFDKTFAHSCSRNSDTGSFKCQCKEGYAGERCDQCAPGYFGNPLELDGECKPCECNNNIDPFDPQSCDSKTGECLKCLSHTTGPKCDQCQLGFYGDPINNHYCIKCDCDSRGSTNETGSICDVKTGKCFCLPNVIGIKCDSCEDQHWDFGNRFGCKSCDCDLTGTFEGCNLCDNYSGQCECIGTRSGRRCDQCSDGFYGTPSVGCKQCECVSSGSKSQTCDKKTGACVCVEGVVGFYCDKCDRGTIGYVPHCSKCGECFENWDKAIHLLKEQLDNLESTPIQINNGLSDFSSKLYEIEAYFFDVKQFLSPDAVASQNISLLNDQLQKLRQKRTEILIKNEQIKIDPNWTLLNTKYSSLLDQFNKLTKQNLSLYENIVDVKDFLPHEAMASIDKSEAACDQAELTFYNLEKEKIEGILAKILTNITNILENSANKIDTYYTNYDEFFNNADSDINRLIKLLGQLNQNVCGSASLECTSDCGAPGCNKCGNYTLDICTQGLESTYTQLESLIAKFNELHKIEDKNLKNLYIILNDIRIKIKISHDDVNKLLDYTNMSIGIYAQKVGNIKKLINKIEEFMKSYDIQSNEIQNTCSAVAQYENKYDFDAYLVTLKRLEKLAKEKFIEANAILNEKNEQIKSIQQIENKIKELEEAKKEYEQSLNEKKIQLKKYRQQIDEVTSNISSINSTIHKTQMQISTTKSIFNDIKSVVNTNEPIVNFYNEIIKGENVNINILSLENKVKEISLIHGESRNKTENLRTQVKILNDKATGLVNKDYQEAFETLIKLRADILRKKEALENKKKSLIDLSNRQDSKQLNFKLTTLTSNLGRLIGRAKQLKKEINDKWLYFSTCN